MKKLPKVCRNCKHWEGSGKINRDTLEKCKMTETKNGESLYVTKACAFSVSNVDTALYTEHNFSCNQFSEKATV